MWLSTTSARNAAHSGARRAGPCDCRALLILERVQQKWMPVLRPDTRQKQILKSKMTIQRKVILRLPTGEADVCHRGSRPHHDRTQLSRRAVWARATAAWRDLRGRCRFLSRDADAGRRRGRYRP